MLYIKIFAILIAVLISAHWTTRFLLDRLILQCQTGVLDTWSIPRWMAIGAGKELIKILGLSRGGVWRTCILGEVLLNADINHTLCIYDGCQVLCKFCLSKFDGQI